MLCKSPTVQYAFWAIPSFISCTGVIKRWGLLSLAQTAIRWLALFKRTVEAIRRHHVFIHA